MIKKGRHSYIYHDNAIELFEPNVHIGNFTSIASGVTFMGKVHHPSVMHKKAVSNYPFKAIMDVDYYEAESKGDIVIGNDVWIGQNALIMDGVYIGDGAIIGANAVVAKSVFPYSINVGNPSHTIDFRFPQHIVADLLAIKWWSWDDKTIQRRMEHFKDIDSFIKKYA